MASSPLSPCSRCVRALVGRTPASSIRSPSAVAAVPARALHTSKPLLKAKKTSSSKRPEIGKEAMPLAEAAAILKAFEVARPQSAFEIHIKTSFDRENALRGRIVLPRDTRNKEETILVFADGEAADEARKTGAKVVVGGEEMIPEVAANKYNFSKVLCTPALLPAVSRALARSLGPKGLMPNVKRGSVTDNMRKAIEESRGALDWRGDKHGMVRSSIGRIHFPIEDLAANVHSLLDSVRNFKAAAAAASAQASGKPAPAAPVSSTGSTSRKNSPILRVHLTSTQGPGIELSDVY